MGRREMTEVVPALEEGPVAYPLSVSRGQKERVSREAKRGEPLHLRGDCLCQPTASFEPRLNR